MTDLPDDRPSDDRPDDGPDEGQPPTAGSSPTGAPPPAGSTPPAGSPPPTPLSPAAQPQAQWPQQQYGGATSEQRNWAVGAHIGALAASVVTGLAVLGPLLVYLIKKDEDAFVREHAREALNFQLTWMIGGVVGGVLAVIVTVVTIGLGLIVLLPVAIGFAIAWIVFMVKAAMAASRGEWYRYPLTVRMVS